MKYHIPLFHSVSCFVLFWVWFWFLGGFGLCFSLWLLLFYQDIDKHSGTVT